MAFTEADRRRLEALKEKERQAKQDERNERKRADNLCKKLFGMSASDVQKNLSGSNYWWQKYNELNELTERLLDTMQNRPQDFKSYVEWREQKAQESAT